jgi:peptidyl-prolyl cis-trans isomerase D
MMRFLRKHRTWLMTVIAILAIPFIFYFVKTDYSAVRPDEFARIYDRKVSIVEARKYARLLDLARALGLSDLPTYLTLGAKDQNEVYGEFIWHLLILRHEADRLGIRPTQSEVIDVAHNLQAFRGTSGFDLKKYDDFVQNALSPNGMGEAQIEELVRDELCLKRIKQLLAIGVSVPETLSKTNFEQAYGKLHTTVIRLRAADVAKEIKISDDDIGKYFEAHKTELKTEEKRKVDFVELSLSDEQKKLTGKERIDALQKLADHANDFSQALLEKGADVKEVAAKFQLPVKTTDEFTAAAPDPQFKATPQLAGSAFKLTAQDPNSDPLQVADGFYILHLVGIVDSHPLTPEEAKPKIVEALKRSRSQEVLSTKGAEIVRQLREAAKSPGSAALEAAIKKAGLKAEKVPPFSLMEEPKATVETKETKEEPKKETQEEPKKVAKKEPKRVAKKIAKKEEKKGAEKEEGKEAKEEKEAKKESPDFIAIKNTASRLEPGEVSDFLPWEEGGLIVVLEKRELPDSAKYAESKASFDERYLNSKRDVVFYEWLRERERDAGLLPAPPEPAASPRPG